MARIVCLGLQCFVLAKLTVRVRKVVTLIYVGRVVAVWLLGRPGVDERPQCYWNCLLQH